MTVQVGLDAGVDQPGGGVAARRADARLDQRVERVEVAVVDAAGDDVVLRPGRLAAPPGDEWGMDAAHQPIAELRPDAPDRGLADDGHDLLAGQRQADAEAGQDAGGHALVLAEQAEEQVLGPDEVVAQPASLLRGQSEHPLGARRQADFALHR